MILGTKSNGSFSKLLLADAVKGVDALCELVGDVDTDDTHLGDIGVMELSPR